MAVTPSPEEIERLAREREARAYRRLTVIVAAGVMAVGCTGAYLLGRGHREATIPTLGNDYRPPAPPVIVYCGREGEAP